MGDTTGKGGGGGGAIVEQGTQDIPLSDLQKETKVTKGALATVTAAWSEMDDNDRKFVIDALKGQTIGVSSRKDSLGYVRSAVNRNTGEITTDKKVRLNAKELKRMGKHVAAGTLIHESVHANPVKPRLSENPTTRRAMSYHEKQATRAASRGDTASLKGHMEGYMTHGIYRAITNGGFKNDPMFDRLTTKGFAGDKTTGNAIMKELKSQYGNIGMRQRRGMRDNELRMRSLERRAYGS